MVKINLTDVTKSEIGYTITKHTDKAQDVVLNLGEVKLSGYSESGKPWSLGVEIQSRLNGWEDLELILNTTACLRRLGVETIGLYIPYLLGARADRKFVHGGCSYLVDVIAPILNLQNYKYVEVLDPHSDVADACIKNLRIVSNVDLVKQSIIKDTEATEREYVLVAPDAGAAKKIYDVAKAIEFEGSVIIANKKRDVITRKITKTEIHLSDNKEGLLSDTRKTYVIVDDICDGGRTFIELAKVIREQDFTARIVLVVSHGLFSYGFDELKEHIQAIYSTNSIKNDLEHISSLFPYPYLHRMEVI